MAMRLPIQLPRQQAAAMGRARLHTTTPFIIKTTAPAKFEARLSTFEVAEASMSPMRKIQWKARIRKLPVPGPKKPS